MLDVVPIEPVAETSEGAEPTLMTSRAGRAAPAKLGHNRVARPTWEVLGDLGLTTPQRSDHADTQLFTRTVRAVDALAAAGRLREGIELARTTLAAGVPPVPEAKLKCALSSLLYSSGRVTEAATEAGMLLADPDLPEDVHEAAEVVVLEAVTAFEDVVWDRAEDAEAIVASREQRGDEVVVVALTHLAHTAWAQGRVSDALDLIRQAVRLDSAGTSRSPRPHPRLWLARMLTCLRRFDEAEAQLRIVRNEDDRVGFTAFAAVFAANRHLAAGRVHAAAVEVDAGLATADAWGTELFTPWALSILATVALRRGDLAAATRHTDGGHRQRAATGPSYGYAQSTWVAAQVAAARVGSREALRVLGDVLDAPHLLRRLLLAEPAAAAWLVRNSLACADRTHAEAVLAQANRLAADNPELPTLTAAAAHANGLFHRDPNALQRATRAHQDPWARASAAEDLATLLAHQGRDDDAVTCYCHAIEDYQQSGSPRDATRARGKLRELGVRMRHQTCIDRHASGWAGLTNTERTVKDEAATDTFRAHTGSVRTVRLGAETSTSRIADAVNG